MPGMLVALAQWLRPLLLIEENKCQKLHCHMPCCLYVRTSRVVDDPKRYGTAQVSSLSLPVFMPLFAHGKPCGPRASLLWLFR